MFVQQFARIAFADIKDVVTWDERIKALEMLLRYLGMCNDKTKAEVTGHVKTTNEQMIQALGRLSEGARRDTDD